MKRILSSSLLIIAACAMLTRPTGAAAPAADLSLAVLPCTNVESTFRKFYPLIHHLKQSAGVTVRLVVPGDLAEFEALLKNGQVDAALQDPHTYASLARYFDNTTLLGTVAEDGTTAQSGVVVVRRDSGVTRLSQLRGRTVLFGPRTSTSKWVAATMLLQAAGIDAGRDIKAANGGCCEDIAFAVTIRSVDAGVVCEHFIRLHEARQGELGVDTDALRVIAQTPPFPTRVLAARRGAPREAVTRLTTALLRLDASDPSQARILASAEILGFKRTTEAEYLRRLRSPQRP
jgi:phosphate/phosphite/phosphonate ABC transporter binding protein